ncbi:MAG: tetratricopeptide repeat protein [Arenimonas sp.]|nr:tetratricopeptide repeat protein [Arenimonas sp.]MBP6625971.1 tetratricopeptide repeat protein [Arenimonas sp.]
MNARHSLILAAVVFLAGSLAPSSADAVRREKKEEERVALYPDATRAEPEGGFSSRLAKPIKKLQDAYAGDGMDAETVAAAEEILANEKAQPYDRAMALLLAGSASMNLGEDAKAESYLGKAIEENALSNDNHYTAMLSLASVYVNTDQFDKANALIERVISETKTTNPEVYGLLGASFYNSGKYAEAINPLKKAIELKAAEPDAGEPDAQWMQMLMASYAEAGQDGEAVKLAEDIQRKNPDDKKALMNLAALYGNLDMQDKAVALLEDARKRGLLTDANDYQRLFGTYYNMGREKDGAAVLEEGLAKGILPADAKNYSLLAQAQYFSDNIPAAIAAAQKAAPLATDGEPALFLAQVLSQEDRNAEAKAAAQQALAKGLKKPGEAWMAIARAEYYSDNIAGATAAYREAAKDPSTREQAQKALAQITQ